MLRIVNTNAEQEVYHLQQPSEAHLSLSKCLRYMRNILGLEAKVSKFNSSSSSYQLLTKMSENQPFMHFQGSTFLPIKNYKGELWGFIQINEKKGLASPIKIKKSISAIESIIFPYIKATSKSNCKSYSALVLEIEEMKAHTFATDQFNEKCFTSFINLSEWLNLKQPFSLNYLRGFKNTLFFISELTTLTKAQRTTLALYSMLPREVKMSSLIICSHLKKEELFSLLKRETGFIEEFLPKEIKVNLK